MSMAITDPAQLAWLQEHLRRNRFLPEPSPELRSCGDGDYRAIGAEFLSHFIRLADLRPNERVLDIGCGVGRMAVPLTQYLSDQGSYLGLDVTQHDVAWCARSITPVYKNFRFRHLDVAHEIYNPGGETNADQVRLPAEDASFDVILLVSVLTHLNGAALLNYAKEVARLLAPGGRCFATAFLVNPPARDALRQGNARISIDPEAEGPELYADAASPMAAVAFDEDFFLEKFLRFGRRRDRQAIYGCWSGRPSHVFQDICILE